MLMCGFCAVSIKAPEDVDDDESGERLPPVITQVQRSSVRGSERASHPGVIDRDGTVPVQAAQLINRSEDL